MVKKYVPKKIAKLLIYPANKAVWMPLTVKCRYIIFHYCPIATTTFWSEHVEIIFFAVWFAIPFMESIFTKLFSTLSAEEMLRVPGLF